MTKKREEARRVRTKREERDQRQTWGRGSTVRRSQRITKINQRACATPFLCEAPYRVFEPEGGTDAAEVVLPCLQCDDVAAHTLQLRHRSLQVVQMLLRHLVDVGEGAQLTGAARRTIRAEEIRSQRINEG